ncbi:ADP-ribose pyrophosphatase, mitochondrial [Nothobranchius furzeri]|uniref:ADP-ribose pyrophosphatase, mitochondrial n=1 Tax=Nothobranchius furzeri TaxID=105023 RepID=A0A1A8A9V3_NOTFU|nr:nudix hydrolase 9 [Nothobranchius furzeri]
MPQDALEYVTTQGVALPGYSALNVLADQYQEEMLPLAWRRFRLDTVRLTFTLFGFPLAICSSGIIRPGTYCSCPYPARSCRNTNPFSSCCCNLYMASVGAMSSSKLLHVKSRCPLYPGSDIKRFPVPDDKVDWTREWPQYEPVSYTAPSVLNRPQWADPDIGSFSPHFNAVDDTVDRKSFEGNYRVENGKPLNPFGRTGLTGRGLLGRWGPNHAADPIVTRWKVNKSGARTHHPVSKLPVLQFVSIKRNDCGEWAIPGGMVDPGEQVSVTLQREFSEEALNSLSLPPAKKEETFKRITELFKSAGVQVYKGYVDDPRNTDNAWMETVAVNFHDESGSSVSELPLQAGDDAGQVQWVDMDSSLALYASHSHFLERVAKERKAHW